MSKPIRRGAPLDAGQPPRRADGGLQGPKVSKTPPKDVAAGPVSTGHARADQLDKPVAPPPEQTTFTPIQARNMVYEAPEGESAMPGAPTLELDGSKVTPGQFMLYNQTVKTVQDLVGKLTYKSNMHIFVSSDGEKDKTNDGIYIQVGIVAPDNYPYKAKDLPDKIVYGRKWRVEKFLPTAEIVQTVLTALKAAEEHEARERLVVNGTTPLNTHLETGLLKDYLKVHGSAPEPPVSDVSSAQKAFDGVRFGGCKIVVEEFEHRKSGRTVVDVKLEADPEYGRVWKEFDGKQLTLLADGDTPSKLVYALMDSTLHEINRGIEESFKYDGFARFSRDNSVDDLRNFNKFSRSARSLQISPEAAAQSGLLYDVIRGENPPTFIPGPANDRIKQALDAQPGLRGNKPKGLD